MITQKRLHELLNYNEATGVFTRKTSKKGSPAGAVVGSRENTGYLKMSIDGKIYRAHRIAWIYFYGEIPGVIDHIDGDRSNNAIQNLRNVDQKTNMENKRMFKRHLAGAHRCRDKWRTSITVDRKTVHIGVFDTAEQASAAYIDAKRKYHKGFVA